MATSSQAVVTAKDLPTRNETESLPSLVTRLGEDVMQLLDAKLNLLKVEIKEDVNTCTRGAVTMAIAGVIAAVGFALLNVAVGFAVSTLFDQLVLVRMNRCWNEIQADEVYRTGSGSDCNQVSLLTSFRPIASPRHWTM